MGSLSFTTADHIATLSIQRAAIRNAIDIGVIRAMHIALDEIQNRNSGARAVVITGCDNVFCSGIDLNSIDLKMAVRQRAHNEIRRFMDPLILRMSTYRIPIVAAVNGAAVGIGMSIALASDIVVAGESAYFHPSFTRLGMVPDAGITFHLARRVGSGRALSSLMLADRIDAKTALEWGLAYQVVPNAEVIARANAVAHRLAAGPCAVLAQLRALHASTFDNSLVKQLRAERSAQEYTLGGTRDCVEGVRAFFEKRDPHFSKD